jgi:protein ImuB
MKRIVSLWLPRFVTDRLCRRPGSSAWRSSPLATIAKARGQLTVAAANAPAQASGILPGQTLADARALEPGLRVLDADPGAEQQALAALADWCTRYTPWAAAEEPAPGGAAGLLLDITGCAHLFGGEAALLTDLVARLEQAGFAARAAAADTAGAAWAMARCAASGRVGDLVVPPGDQRQALAALPVAALRLPPETATGLERLGLRRVGDLYPLPRAPLARRFGTLVGRRLDQALGRLDEPISPRQPIEPWRLRLAFAEPIGRRADIDAGLERLLVALCRRLDEEMKGARRLALALYRTDGTRQCAAIGTSRPAREAGHLARLFAEKLDGLDHDFDHGLGIDLLELTAPVVEAMEPVQTDSLPAANEDTPAALATLVDRLTNRLGITEVRRLVPVASHVPERAQRPAPALGSVPTAPDGWRRTRPRPLRLFVRPQPVEAVAPVPDDPPLLFRWHQQLHRIRRADGPERIADEWWHGSTPAEAELRDYYRVEDEAGRRFWLYREGLYDPARPPRWFLHGLFA